MGRDMWARASQVLDKSFICENAAGQLMQGTGSCSVSLSWAP